jgi:hypothetical protein
VHAESISEILRRQLNQVQYIPPIGEMTDRGKQKTAAIPVLPDEKTDLEPTIHRLPKRKLEKPNRQEQLDSEAQLLLKAPLVDQPLGRSASVPGLAKSH